MIFSWLIFLKEKIIGDNWLLEFFDGNSSCFATQIPFLRYRSGLGEIILFKPWYCFDSFHSVSFTSPSQKLWSSSYSEWNFFIPYLSKSLVQFRNCVFKLLLQQILDSSVYKTLGYGCGEIESLIFIGFVVQVRTLKYRNLVTT